MYDVMEYANEALMNVLMVDFQFYLGPCLPVACRSRRHKSKMSRIFFLKSVLIYLEVLTEQAVLEDKKVSSLIVRENVNELYPPVYEVLSETDC